MPLLSYWLRRGLNGVRKVVAGLRPFGESVWPGVRNDLFVAHESIYRFAAPFARERDVLDAGCGTGYGAEILASSGARSVLGVDIDSLSIRYARRRYGRPGLTFEVADCEAWALPEASFGLVFCSNVLEHLHDPRRFLDRAAAALGPGGRAVIAVPPIVSAHDAEVHAGIHYHRSNLAVPEWASLLADLPWRVRSMAHRFVGAGPEPDFGSPAPSRLRPEDFTFLPATLTELTSSPCLTAVFVAER